MLLVKATDEMNMKCRFGVLFYVVYVQYTRLHSPLYSVTFTYCSIHESPSQESRDRGVEKARALAPQVQRKPLSLCGYIRMEMGPAVESTV